MEINWKHPRDFNLVTPEDLKRHEAKRIRGSILIFGATLALLVSLVLWRFPSQETLLSKTLKRPPPPTLRLTDVQWTLLEKHLFFSRILSALGDASQGNTWLSSLEYNSERKTLTLFGQGYSAENITNFAHLFQQLASIEKGKIVSFTQDGDLVRFKWEGTQP